MKAEIDWLDDPEVFRVNRLPAHSDHRFYRDMEELKEGKSALEQSLNGIWMAGYDKIHYINTMYPWEGHIYRRPAYSLGNGNGWKGMFSQAVYNPVGSYVKEFDLEKGLLGSRVIICLEGVEQALYLWLNGSFVGYAEDSFTPSEFDLTPYLKEKGNKLAIEVHKRSSAAFLEDQDFFRFFGIFRNVTLYAKPKMHVEDFWAQPELKEDGTGSLAVEARVSMEQGRSGRMEITLEDGEGNSLLHHEMLLSPDGADREKSGIYKEVYGKMQKQALGKVVPWENKTPVLYFLLIRLYDEEGGLVEAVPYSIGFRKIEIRDKVIRLNGKRLIINGVNRHEWSAEKGRCIGMEEMRQDMDCFLANHINAVRTCHYPNQIPWYDMCDKNGIYMMAEANLESHGSWQKMGACEPSWNVPGSLPQWREAVLDRMISNFELFKNHVSVLFWSLGNESYAGDNIEAMNRYLKEKEDGRLVHYEGVFHNRAYEDSVSDVESRMYAPPEQIREYLENQPKKPFLLCEYMHDMGNSLGGMDSYMKLLDAYEMYHGGFIWDYIDQAIFVEDEVTGRKVLRYGGDFDDRPSDYSFSGNGIVFADRTEKPAMQEVRYYYGQYK